MCQWEEVRMIWTFKQERNCSTISVCYSGCEMTPRRNSFARRQPPIQPVLDASFLLMQRSGTHALCVKLTGSHLPVLRFRSFEPIVLKKKKKRKLAFQIRFGWCFVRKSSLQSCDESDGILAQNLAIYLKIILQALSDCFMKFQWIIAKFIVQW